MNLKSLSLLILAFVLEENGGSGLVAVSTTHLPLEDRVTNNSHRLEVIERQIRQIQNSLEDIKLTNRLILGNMVQKEQLPPKQSLPRNCQEIKERGGNGSHTYFIKPDSSPGPFLVRCNMDTLGGGWTYILNRFDGSQNFDLGWHDYVYGFGNLDKEFWLGLNFQYHLTRPEINELLVEIVDWNNKKAYAHYTGFNMGNVDESYRIRVLEGYNGDAGDAFSEHFGMKFSAKGIDHDTVSFHCADDLSGGWWYKGCGAAKLTGKYSPDQVKSGQGILWKTFRQADYSLKEARMMVRPRGF